MTFSKFSTETLLQPHKSQNIQKYTIFDADDDLFLWLTDERRLTLFPAGTIVRDPHHSESPTRRKQDLNLRGT